MKWLKIEIAPKNGTEILVCNVNCGSVLQLVWYDRVHKCWVTKGKPDLFFHWTHWTLIENIPKRDL